MQTDSRVPNDRWALIVTAVVIALAIALGYGAATLSRSAMSRNGASTQVSGAGNPLSPTRTEGVVEVLDQHDGLYSGRLAVKNGDTYRRTDERVEFRVPVETPFVMGVAADLHVGAIVHVRGQVDSNILVADRIVILTPNVRLQ